MVIVGIAYLLMATLSVAAQQQSSCPVTKLYQSSLFVPPWPYAQNAGQNRFWFGTDRLWTALPVDGTWRGLPLYTPHDGFRQKMAFYREGFTVDNDPQPPKLVVKARRLDADGASYVLDQPLRSGATIGSIHSS